MARQDRDDLPQLWTSISHEIRTPLNIIKGMTNISEHELYDMELVKECMEKIKEGADRMQVVVNALVDYAAITRKSVEIHNAKIDFKSMITEIAMHSYIISKHKNCHFNMHVQDVSEEALIGDESRISQVLLTLLNMVVKYTASEGIIDFTVQQVGISNAKVFMRFGLRSTALEFTDEIVEYLNDNSLYMDPDLLAPVGAFGITEMNALYFSYLMGGKIKACNRPGDYSEITFDLEFDRTEQPYSMNGTKLFANQRILIVADSQEMCDERGRMLVDMGMQYETATEVEETLEKIGEAEDKERDFTLCIIDWEMKDEQCITMIQEIRDIFGQGLKIIVTSHDPSERFKEVQQYGANYVIDRTIFRSTLFDALISIEKGIQMHHDSVSVERFDFSGNRILVAEDVALNMEVITKLLSRVHVEVTCVENGMEAVTQFERKPEGYFDAILLDINMPVMDGYEAAHAIRQSNKEDSNKIPIYAMTANAFKEDVEKALDAGMDGHIAKPIDVSALYRLLNQVLKNKEVNELEKLRDLAEQDPLTGCLNRRGFDNHIKHYLDKRIPVAYIAVDVDDFKMVNDRFGHETGDEILKKIVRIFKRKFRATDLFARFGGDEFAVVLIDFKKHAAFLKHRIDEINEELLHPEDGLPPVTVSVGAVISENGYKKDLYTSADRALYQSKHIGKGICQIIGEDNPIPENNDIEGFVYNDNLNYMNDSIKVIINNKHQLRTSLMIKNKPVGFITGFCDEIFSIYSFNGFLPGLLGYNTDDFLEKAEEGFVSFVHPDDTAYQIRNYELEKMQSEKIRLCNKNGDYMWFNMEYIITKTTEDQSFWLASLRNIDDNLVGNLCEDDYRLVSTIDPELDTVIIEKGAYLASARELRTQTKYNYSLLVENAIAETVKANCRENFLERASLKNITEKLSFGGVYEFTVYQKWGSKDYYVVRHKYRYMSGKKNSILCTWEPLGYRAEIDELTDTYNESGFYRVVDDKLKYAKKNDRYTILYFNISGFKAWNSMLGRENADELLKLTARNLLKSDLQPIALSRLVVDQYACLISRDNYDSNLISKMCRQPLEINGNRIELHLKCGIFHIDNTRESVRSMCDKAKLAMDSIENEHASPYYLFDAEINKKYIQHKQVVNQVGNALKRKEIKVYYQPIVNTRTRRIASAEALIRWVLPGGKVMSPSLFIPALEEQGRIADVDLHAQNSVREMLYRRVRSGKQIVPVSVNVSRMDFLNKTFIEKLDELASSGMELNDNMRLEVTESSFTEVGTVGENLLKALRQKGIKILMDDYGTGFSTLAGITSLEFDLIKIDRSFINEIGKGNGAEVVIENTISMCHALNMKVVAEGVETEKQYNFLCESKCDYVQGYLFYKPMPEEAFEEVLDRELEVKHE